MLRRIADCCSALLFVFTVCLSPASSAQPAPGDSTATLVPGARYAADGLHRFFMGEGYRDLWTSPITVPVLNLKSFAGGLTPVRIHVGSQTTSLRLQGADGRMYQFRSVDKHPSNILPEEIRATIAGKVIQDGVSSTHPVGGIVAASLLETAGILHITPRLFVMPDDPALGAFRSTFAGMLGTLEERADENSNARIAFAGALKITGSGKLYERINKSPKHRIDIPAFLKARLVDLFIGDRDRHRDNWRWAKFEEKTPRIWEPISRDHDHAFEKIQGIFPAVASFYTPGIIAFGPKYTDIERLTWNGQEVDRRFFAGVEKSVWDSVAVDLQHRFTDEALERAIRTLPPEYYATNGPELLAGMKGRRDRLLAEADVFYRFLAHQVDIHATDADEEAIVTMRDDRSVLITIRERKKKRKPYFHRVFHRNETQEIRLRMFGGDDHVVVRGSGNPGITLRIAGNEGNDILTDSTDAGGLHFYDDPSGKPRTEGIARKVDRRPNTEWVGSDLDRYPPREWGHVWAPVAWVEYDNDFGLFLGGGITRRTFGFRKTPFATEYTLRAGFTTDPSAIRLAFDADIRRENSDIFYRLETLVSGIEVLRFYGFGNNTSRQDRGSDFFLIDQKQYHVSPSIVVPLSPAVTALAGPTLTYSDTKKKRDRYITTLGDNLYGGGDFGEIGVHAGLKWDTRDRTKSPTRGYFIRTDGRFFPAVWDVKRNFGSLDAVAMTYLSAATLFEPTLALRAGAMKVWGTAPFHEAAYIGGHRTLRGWHRQRFAGDASLYVNADLRLFISRFFFVLPGDFGIFGLADAGRIYLDGNTPGGWHTAAGGGIWVSFLNRANTFALGLATNEERTNVFVRAGFDF